MVLFFLKRCYTPCNLPSHSHMSQAVPHDIPQAFQIYFSCYSTCYITSYVTCYVTCHAKAGLCQMLCQHGHVMCYVTSDVTCVVKATSHTMSHAKSSSVTDVDCASKPCQNGAYCYTSNGDFKCICRSGFTGSRCEIGEAMARHNFIMFFCRKRYHEKHPYPCACV